MAFLDNSGDIILDAVLTDTGRLRLAQGDGSFKISKFALGDDEINYGLYNKDHASGSAYFDLDVLQTPVLEAFTNNTSNLKTKLISIPRTNLLYMPILKLNKNNITEPNTSQNIRPTRTFSRDGSSNNVIKDGTGAITYAGGAAKTDNKFYVAVDKFTFEQLTEFQALSPTRTADPGQEGYIAPAGIIQGYQSSESLGGIIRIDQGIDTSEISTHVGIDADMLEKAFIVETDYRLGRVKAPDSTAILGVNFIDDDNIATYYVSSNDFVSPKGRPADTNNKSAQYTNNKETSPSELLNVAPQVFDGPRGECFQFRIEASMELQQSTYLFTQIGFTEGAQSSGNIAGFTTSGASPVQGKNIYYIDSTVRVVGANTGYRLDVPVRFVKIAN